MWRVDKKPKWMMRTCSFSDFGIADRQIEQTFLPLIERIKGMLVGCRFAWL